MIGWTLCSGIGAPEVSAPWMDWRLAAEIEPFPRAVLQERFGYKLPEDHNQGDPMLWSDMTEVTPELARSRGVPLPDVLVAGTPCQAFSIAGLRGGTGDARGNLTLKFVETCHAIVDARPDGKLAVLWENVPGVLSDKGNAFGCFLGGLVGAVDALPRPAGGSWPSEGMVEGPRARAAWCVLDAQWFGVAQRRRRVFVVIDFGNCCDPAQILLEPDSLRGDSPPRREAGPVAAALTANGVGAGGGPDDNAAQANHIVEGHHGAIAGTVSSKWSKGSGGPAGDETQNMVAFDCKGTEVQHDASGVSPPLRSMGHNNRHHNAGGHAAVAIQERAVAENPKSGPDGAGYRTDDCAYTLEARNQVQSVAFDLRGRDGGSSRSYVAVGGSTTHALTGEGHDASEDGTGRGTPVVAMDDCYGLSTSVTPKFAHDLSPTLTVPSPSGGGQPPAVAFTQNTRDEVRQINGDGPIAGALAAETGAKQQTYLACGPIVRRLMPVECARLQGFPDDHCNIIYRGKPAADGPQYKALGNSMAVPVISYILSRMRESIYDHRS